MDIFSMTEFAISPVWFIVIFLLMGLAGGLMAKNNGKSFALGFALGLFLNIGGLLVIAYVDNFTQKRIFDPDFKHSSSKNITTIERLAELNREGLLNDEEFKSLKMKIFKK